MGSMKRRGGPGQASQLGGTGASGSFQQLMLTRAAEMKRRQWIINAIFAVLAAALVVIAYANRSFFAGPSLLLLLAGVIVLMTVRRRLLNPKSLRGGKHMARLIQEQRYKEAIDFAESGNLPYHDVPGYINLVGAYYFMGDKRKARRVLKSLGSSLQYRGVVRRTVEEWQVKLGV